MNLANSKTLLQANIQARIEKRLMRVPTITFLHKYQHTQPTSELSTGKCIKIVESEQYVFHAHKTHILHKNTYKRIKQSASITIVRKIPKTNPEQNSTCN